MSLHKVGNAALAAIVILSFLVFWCVTATAAQGVVFEHSKGGVTLDSPQEIWSSTKWITGVAILREVELGRLELDEPISAHLPYWPTAANDTRSGITLRHLLGFASVSLARVCHHAVV